jgi:YD repeat-containing protein
MSSGLMVDMPKFAYLNPSHKYHKEDLTYYAVECFYLTRSSVNVAVLGAVEGGVSAYEYVTVLHGENGEFGKTVNKFTFFEDEYDHKDYPFPPPTSYDWLRGSPEQVDQYVFDTPSNSFQLVQRTNNTYKALFNPGHYLRNPSDSVNFNVSYIPAIKVTMLLPELPEVFGMVPAQFDYSLYKVVSAWVYKESSVDTFYFKGSEPLVIKQIFEYDNPNHIQPTGILAITSNGGTIYTKTKYPLDYAIDANAPDTQSKALAMMQAEHIITPAIELYNAQLTGSRLMIKNGRLTFYKDLLPDSIKLILPGSYDTERELAFRKSLLSSDPGGKFTYDVAQTDSYIQFERYDSFGNILQLRQAGGRPRSSIWSIDGTQQLAIAENAAYDQLFHTSFEEGWNGTVTGGKTGEKAYAGTLTLTPTQLPSISGNYQLSYWEKKAGEKWQYHTSVISLPQSSLTIGSVGTLIDEVRIHHVEAMMKTYTYKHGAGISSETDANGRVTYYEYDTNGRLVLVKDDEGNILQHTKYQYAR